MATDDLEIEVDQNTADFHLRVALKDSLCRAVDEMSDGRLIRAFLNQETITVKLT